MTLTSRFEAALLYAAHVHRDGLRKGTSIPYVSHLLIVAGLVLDYGGNEDEAIGALLHDAVEDGGGVGAGHLDTMGIRLLRGRDFTADDGPASPFVTVISKPLADELFPNADAADAIGKQLTFGQDQKTQKTLTIVGVTTTSRRRR